MTLKAVIFDFGGVLVRTADWRRRAAWERRLGLAPHQSEAIVFGAETNYDVQLGYVTDGDHWLWVQQRLGLSAAEAAAFQRDFFADDVLDSDLLAYIDRLRSHYTIGLLSNAGADARRFFAEQHAVLDHFDSVTISAEEGIMKPAPAIFQIALARAGAAAGEAIFVDDVLANVEAARTLGMQAVHFEDPARARRELVALTGVK